MESCRLPIKNKYLELLGILVSLGFASGSKYISDIPFYYAFFSSKSKETKGYYYTMVECFCSLNTEKQY